MACTNRRSGWPGYRWGRGPDWATTGKIRPVTEIQRGVDVAVDDLTGHGARQPLADSVFTDQPAGGTVGVSAAVVDLAGGKPAIRDNQLAAESGGLVDQLRPDKTHSGVRHGPPERRAPHATFHGGHVEIFAHDPAIP